MPAPEALKDHPELQELVRGPEYSEATGARELDPLRIEWGSITDESFERRFKRPTRWQVHDDTVEYYAPIGVEKGEDPPPFETPADLRRHGVKVTHRITAEELARNPISSGVADTLLIFKRIEDNLPWFTWNLLNEFPDVKGVDRASGQWTVEEREHSNIASLILRTVPVASEDGTLQSPMSQEDIDQDYEDTQLNEWKPPFESYLENIAYPYFQERNTSGNYVALANKMKDEGNIAGYHAMMVVAQDESWHGASYRDMLISHAKLDLDVTVKAVARVAWHFRMPSMALMRDRIKDTNTVISTIGYNRDQITKMLRSGLAALPFFPREYIEPLATGYFDEESARVKKIMYGLIREKARARKADRQNNEGSDRPESNGSGLVLPTSGEILPSQGGENIK